MACMIATGEQNPTGASGVMGGNFILTMAAP